MIAPSIHRREPALVLVLSAVTNFITSAIQRDQFNRVVEKLESRLPGDAGLPA